MVCYVVIDTNVLVSALISSNDDAATVLVIGKMLAGEVIPVYSSYIMQEYENVLNRDKFHFSSKTVTYLLSAIEKFGLYIDPSPKGITLPDEKDIPFYEVVLEKRIDNSYLVTGNIKHFPAVPYVVTPREFLEILSHNM